LFLQAVHCWSGLLRKNPAAGEVSKTADLPGDFSNWTAGGAANGMTGWEAI